MTSDDDHDPVNRWATEHYGFEEDRSVHTATQTAREPEAAPPLPSAPHPPVTTGERPRRRTALISSGVLSLALIACIGGAAVAAPDAGDGGGGPGGGRVAVVQLDGDNRQGVAVASARFARRKLHWENWYALHLSMYVAVALSFSHQLAGPDLAGRPWLQVSWGVLYTFTFALVLRYRFIMPAVAAFRHRLRVVAVIPEASGVVSIVIEGRHLAELRAQPGQFFRWRFLTADSWTTAHPFSLSAPPVGNRLRLTVKALGDGSERLQRVPVGTALIAEGPYGAMTAARRTRRDVLLIAGGVGITPMRALFETMTVLPGQDLMLLYRARGRDELIFRRELDALAARREARVIYLLGSDRELLSARTLLRLVPALAERDVYLCGPPGLSAAVRASLHEAGLPPAHLHEERFAL